MLRRDSQPGSRGTPRTLEAGRRSANERQKLVPSLELALECAKHGAGNSERGLLFNAAHHHAEVLGLEDDTDTQGVNCALNGFGDLASETLLHLEATGEDIDEACHLAEADDFALGR